MLHSSMLNTYLCLCN